MSSPKTETLGSEWTNEMRQGERWNMVSPQCVQSYLHGILLSFYWKEEHSGLWGRKVLSLENYFGRSSRGDTGEELSCSIFLISLNEWTKHFIVFPGGLWPLHMAEHESMIMALARDHSGVGRGTQVGKQQQETEVAVTPGYSPLLSPGGRHLDTFQKGNTWVPHSLDGCHTPFLPAEILGRTVNTARITQIPHLRRGTVSVGWEWVLNESHHHPEPMCYNFSCFLVRDFLLWGYCYHTGVTQTPNSSRWDWMTCLVKCSDSKGHWTMM